MYLLQPVYWTRVVFSIDNEGWIFFQFISIKKLKVDENKIFLALDLFLKVY